MKAGPYLVKLTNPFLGSSMVFKGSKLMWWKSLFLRVCVSPLRWEGFPPCTQQTTSWNVLAWTLWVPLLSWHPHLCRVPGLMMSTSLVMSPVWSFLQVQSIKSIWPSFPPFPGFLLTRVSENQPALKSPPARIVASVLPCSFIMEGDSGPVMPSGPQIKCSQFLAVRCNIVSFALPTS